MKMLTELEARNETTIYVKEPLADDYIRYGDVAVLIEAVRELAAGRRYRYGYVTDTPEGGWTSYSPATLALIGDPDEN